ncbi:hypothetical protein B0H17DRAFT_1152412 [Mycena rosella]|uniref:Uncharacterized protein n=1 Tax=Mycena rosella TaxID=1033263 RepID=A0AAD7FDW5_MYCRO|nr:hypothetical protein B0H17DRAFT_1152412 [Mycena rosella]
MVAVPRLPLSATRRIITQLLLQPADLGNPDWMPNIPIAEFLRKRVRPVAYFLQRSTCEEWGFVGPMVELLQEEAEDVRALLLLLVGTLERMVSALMKPEIVCMLECTRTISHNSALPIDFPEYDAAGNLLDLEGGFYFPLMASQCFSGKKEGQADGVIGGEGAKPSHFFGTFDSMGKAKRPTPRFPVRDEFLNLDFPTMQLVHEFSLHPFMRRLSREQFEPMAQFAIHIRDNFSWSPHTLAEGKRKAMRQSLRSYLRHTETLSDIIAETVYGFEGDHEDLKRTILRGKLAAVYCYALDLRQNAVDRSFIGEGPEEIADLFLDNDPVLEEGKVNPSFQITPAFLRSLLPANPMDASLNLNAYPGIRSVEDYVRIPEAIIARLELYRSYRREPVEYAHLPDGVLKYVTEVLRPYPETIVHCIPATVFRAIDLSSGHEGEIGIYVADYVCQAVGRGFLRVG